MQTGSSENYIGCKSGKTTDVPLWYSMEGAWLWTLGIYSESGFHYGVERNLSVSGAAEVKLFSILHFKISCRLVFKHLFTSLGLAENSKLSKNKIFINFV